MAGIFGLMLVVIVLLFDRLGENLKKLWIHTARMNRGREMELKSTAVAGPVLEVKNLSCPSGCTTGGLGSNDLKVISNLNLDVRPGIYGGSRFSGSGKACWPMPLWAFCRKTPLWKGRFPWRESP